MLAVDICNTWSWKKNALQRISQNEKVRIISSTGSNKGKIGQAGIQLFTILYSEKKEGSINDLQYFKFMA